MGYFNKGAINFAVVALFILIISGTLALMLYSAIASNLIDNADFNCLVGVRLASIAGATKSPCKTRDEIIQPLEFKKNSEGNLVFDFKNCPQVADQADGLNIESLSQLCGSIKLAEKGLTCWTNYMSGTGNLPTSTCFNLCMKPSYGSINIESELITLPNQFIDIDKHIYIFPGKKFDYKSPEDISKLENYSSGAEVLGIELERTDALTLKVTKKSSRSRSIVIRIPFETVYPYHLRETFENQITTRGTKQQEKYSDRIDIDLLRINTVPVTVGGGLLQVIDTNFIMATQVIAGNIDFFYIKEGQSWIIQYVDSEDWVQAGVPFTDIDISASELTSHWDTDISDDSLNYAFNGVC